MADHSYNGGARGGARAHQGNFRIDVHPLAVWIAQAKQIIKETGAAPEYVVGFARRKGIIKCEDSEVESLCELIRKP